MAYVALWCTLLLSGVLGASAVGKARSRDAFVAFTGAVRTVGGIPARWSRPAAVAVVAAESTLAVLLLVGPARRLAAGGALLLLAAFTAVLARMLARRDQRPCHCFGSGDAPVAARHVVRNLLLAAGASVVAAVPGFPVDIGPLLVCLPAVIAVVGMVVMLDDLALVLRRPS
jgi:uncharacterized membrane protein YphA (DoxX/SURF4 family)